MAEFIVILFLAALFFIPTIVAFHREHHYRWIIFGINAVLGITGVGWIFAFIWAAWPNPTSENTGKISDVFSGIGHRVKDIKAGADYQSPEDMVNLILKYNELRINGAISEDEFNIKKRDLLSPNLANESLSSIELIKKLNELRINGIITDEEFQAKKQEIL